MCAVGPMPQGQARCACCAPCHARCAPCYARCARCVPTHLDLHQVRLLLADGHLADLQGARGDAAPPGEHAPSSTCTEATTRVVSTGPTAKCTAENPCAAPCSTPGPRPRGDGATRPRPAGVPPLAAHIPRTALAWVCASTRITQQCFLSSATSASISFLPSAYFFTYLESWGTFRRRQGLGVSALNRPERWLTGVGQSISCTVLPAPHPRPLQLPSTSQPAAE